MYSPGEESGSGQGVFESHSVEAVLVYMLKMCRMSRQSRSVGLRVKLTFNSGLRESWIGRVRLDCSCPYKWKENELPFRAVWVSGGLR